MPQKLDRLDRRGFLRGSVGVWGASLAGLPLRSTLPSRFEHHTLVVHHPDLERKVLAHLTDLHFDGPASAERCRQGVRLANAQRPDLALVTGDLVTHDPAFIEPMAEVLARLRCPTIVTLGNHDHWAGAERVEQALSAHGITVLRNRSLVVNIGRARLRLIGIDDAHTGHDDVTSACADLRADDDLRLVLAHCPSSADDLAPHKADLVLAGHTHGGQIQLPLLTRLVVKSFLRQTYVKGFYATPGGRLYVNRGWGTVGVPVRLGVPAEIAFFHTRMVR